MTKKSVMLGKISARELQGPLFDFIDKLQTENSQEWFEGFKRFLRKENPWPPATPPKRIPPTYPWWHDENGVIRFNVISKGNTSEYWIERFSRFGDDIKVPLSSSDFIVTKGVKTEVVILKGELFKDEARTMRNIRAEAKKRKLLVPSMEIACLIRAKVETHHRQKMGLSGILTMHKPVKDSSGRTNLLYFGSDGDLNAIFLSTERNRPNLRLPREWGFAFIFPKADDVT